MGARNLHAVPAPAEGPAATDPVAVFTAERRRLVGLAYRITGSLTDADDVVQEAWLRFERAGTNTIERPAAWLTTVVARIALDHLKAARHQREVYVGPWLPEPVVSDPRAPGPPGPEDLAEMAQSLTMGFLHMLETLGAVERVVFVLADVFDMPYAEIAETVGKTPAACRQLASRARRRIKEGVPLRYQPPDDDAARTVGELLAATSAGDMDQVVRLLSDDAVLISDGGPHRRAARQPVRGPQRMGRFLVNVGGRFEQLTIEPVTVNGELGMVVYEGGARIMTMAVHVEDGRVRAIHMVLNPDKLAALDRHIDLV